MLNFLNSKFSLLLLFCFSSLFIADYFRQQLEVVAAPEEPEEEVGDAFLRGFLTPILDTLKAR